MDDSQRIYAKVPPDNPPPMLSDANDLKIWRVVAAAFQCGFVKLTDLLPLRDVSDVPSPSKQHRPG